VLSIADGGPWWKAIIPPISPPSFTNCSWWLCSLKYVCVCVSVCLGVTYRGFYRFLALKNLAAVFLQQGSTHYENALHCYLQAVEIDSKDSVVWNKLGTLSCSMGSLSISRWAFEQGLLCSPNNCKHLIF